MRGRDRLDLVVENDALDDIADIAAVEHMGDGISCSASRHVAGERPVHQALERALAEHYSSEGAD